MLLLARLIDLYSLIVLVAVILSWIPVDRRNPLAASYINSQGTAMEYWDPERSSPADAVDFLFFGYVMGQFEEWGYFLLSELETARGPLGLPIERDLYFQPGPFSQVIAAGRRRRTPE